jgi:transposase
VRSIWELIGRLDLSLYHAQIEAVEGHAGRDHIASQLLICLWLYAYSRGISSAREVARQCEFEPGFQWFCGLRAISHRTLSGFRSENKAALNDLFVQVLGMLSAEGLSKLERVTLDGTKIKANAGGNTFRRKEKLQAHLELAREQVGILNAEGEQEESLGSSNFLSLVLHSNWEPIAGAKPRLIIEAHCSICGPLHDQLQEGLSTLRLAMRRSSSLGHVVVLNGTTDLPEDSERSPAVYVSPNDVEAKAGP